MATLADLDELALALPQATKELTSDGRPEYYVHGKLFCCHRGRRKVPSTRKRASASTTSSCSASPIST